MRTGGGRTRARRPALATALAVATVAAFATAGLASFAAGAADPGWPCWRGPYGNGSAASCGEPLVGSPAKTRLVWTNEERLPGARVGDSRKVRPKAEDRMSGGFGSPVAVDGRVYLSYYVPSGTVHDDEVTRKHLAGGGFGREKWYIDADDVLISIDAKTGKTLWKREFAGKGMNWIRFNKGGPCNPTPCVAGGKACFVGSSGRVYCVDARTGEPLWESDIGKRHRLMEELRAVCKRERRLAQFNRSFAGSPVVARGVLVASDFMGFKVQTPVKEYNWGLECGLIGFDGEKGTRLWHVPRCLGTWASPVRWVHRGEEYVLAASGAGKAVCVEPRTGEVLWSLDVGKNGGTVSVDENHLVCNGGIEKPELACYRIDPRGGRKSWALPAEWGYSGMTPPVIYDGHVYARLKSGRLVCVEIETGKVAAKTDFPGSMGFMVAADGRLFIDADNSHDRSEVHVFDADPAAFGELGPIWRLPNATGYMVPITPALAGGRLYVRSQDNILCYELRAAAAAAMPAPAGQLASGSPPAGGSAGARLKAGQAGGGPGGGGSKPGSLPPKKAAADRAKDAMERILEGEEAGLDLED